MTTLLNKVGEKARQIVRAQRVKLFGYPMLRNVNGTRQEFGRPRALLIYLVEPFQLRTGDRRFKDHQNLKQSKQIAALLGDAGYIVDVADYKDERLVSNELPRTYDIIISHRGDLGLSGKRIPRNTVKVYLATGMNHSIYNRNLLRRYGRLKSRRQCVLQPPELNEENLPFVESADAVVGFGNEYTVGTWKELNSGPLFSFNNYGFKMPQVSVEKRDFANTRRAFLFFASRNQVGKGLDLLLEIFSRNKDLHLFVCSLFKHESDFCACYHRELFQTPNIHPVGAVRIGSDEYRNIVQQCAFVVVPSCSEGQPGAVVQGMHAGLIPLLTKESGIDTDDFGWLFENDSEQSIEQRILDVSTLSPDELQNRSQRTREVAGTRYSEEAFLSQWREIIDHLQQLSQTKMSHEIDR